MLHFGYEVWISGNRKERIPEYDVKFEGEDGRTIACYIPSESGKEFQVRWKDHNGPAANHASMRVLMDGHAAGKTCCPPGVAGKRLGISTTSADTYQPFQFASLQTTDDDGALWGSGAPAKLGSIELHVVHVRPEAIKARFKAASFAGTGPVHERSKKAGSHCVALGRTVPHRKGDHSRVKSVPLDKKAGPVARFVFRYRPAAILRAQDIMPPCARPSTQADKAKARPASPPIQRSGCELTLADDEDRKPVKAERAVGTELKVVSGEVIELSSDEEDVPVVKREPRPRLILQHDPGDVIDLTLD